MDRHGGWNIDIDLRWPYLELFKTKLHWMQKIWLRSYWMLPYEWFFYQLFWALLSLSLRLMTLTWAGRDWALISVNSRDSPSWVTGDTAAQFFQRKIPNWVRFRLNFLQIKRDKCKKAKRHVYCLKWHQKLKVIIHIIHAKNRMCKMNVLFFSNFYTRWLLDDLRFRDNKGEYLTTQARH